MSTSTSRWPKVSLGLALGFAIGVACRILDIPSPAPSMLSGALLVMAMTIGYVVTDRWLELNAARRRDL
ncbi:MAG TPA: DUF1427 family protein [Burkholderiaceae bacterium]|nr:DUF1427 family protein [Burkholderiaceae bacterium]